MSDTMNSDQTVIDELNKKAGERYFTGDRGLYLIVATLIERIRELERRVTVLDDPTRS